MWEKQKPQKTAGVWCGEKFKELGRFVIRGDIVNQGRILEAVSYTQNIKPEIKVSDLATYSDGTIRYKGSVIPMRDQLNDLCRMFMYRPNQLILCDEIRDEIIRANRRKTTTFITIAKYQSIAETLNKKWPKSRNGIFSEQNVKDWFKESGTLCEDYRLYEGEMDNVHIETMSIIRRAGARVREQNFRLANEMLIALMGSSNDGVKLAAIKEILDRVEGKPKETIHVSEEELAELSVEDRWNIIPYEMRLQLSRDQYPKEAAEKILNWVETGKSK